MTKKKETKKAEKKPTTMESKIEKQMGSSNIKTKGFKTLELENYEMSREDIELILEYQKKLPVLQEDNENWVDGRLLWEQLGVKSEYANWIKQNISDMDLVENEDYKIDLTLKSNQKGRGGDRRSVLYNIKVSTAKEIAMVAGAKGGRTSKELKENSKLARKYFIAIESAFKNRKEWNYDRADTLVGFKGLQQAFMNYRAELLPNVPDWARNNIQIAEFWAINDVIIGMTSNEFRNVMGLTKKESIRNAFTEHQLEYVALLEKFDADLIAIHNIFDFEERHKKLYEKYMLLSKGKFA
jgi:phage anti-repressor protein